MKLSHLRKTGYRHYKVKESWRVRVKAEYHVANTEGEIEHESPERRIRKKKERDGQPFLQSHVQWMLLQVRSQ